MTEQTAPKPQDSSADGSDQPVPRLAAENERLRRRVDELESTLNRIEQRLDDEAGTTKEAAPRESNTVSELPLVTSGGQPTKVIGQLGDENGIGVYGTATGEGATVGVMGEVDSTDGTAIEAFGNDGRGVHAVSASDHAIRATNQTAMETIRAVNSGTAEGARALSGETEASDGGIGIHGRAVVPDEGEGYGVSGEIAGDGEGYGLHTPNDAAVEGDLAVGGEIEIEQSELLSVSLLRFGEEQSLSYSNAWNRFRLTGAGHFETAMDIRVNDPSNQRTAGPIAKGAVALDDGLPDLQNAVNIESVTWRSDEEDFEIELTHVEEYTFADYAVQAIPVTPTAVATGTSNDDNLVIEFEGGAMIPFQLAVWELPDGQETS